MSCQFEELEEINPFQNHSQLHFTFGRKSDSLIGTDVDYRPFQ